MQHCRRLIMAAAMGLAALSGGAVCAATPPVGGTVSLEFASDNEGGSSHAAFADAVGEALAGQGMTVLEDPGHAAYVLELTLTRTEVGTGSARVSPGKASVETGMLGVGAGVAVPFSAGETRLVPLQRIRMEMRLRKRGESEAVWNAAAVTVRAAGTRKGADAVVATDLSRALLRAYPAQPEDVIAVP